ALACIGLATACGSSSPSASSGAGPSPLPTGPVNVAYASSLQYLNEKVIAPAFKKADGYTFVGTGGAAGTLESEIAAGTIHPSGRFGVRGRRHHHAAVPEVHELVPPFRWHEDGPGVHPEQPVRQPVQGLRRWQPAAAGLVHLAGDARS